MATERSRPQRLELPADPLRAHGTPRADRLGEHADAQLLEAPAELADRGAGRTSADERRRARPRAVRPRPSGGDRARRRRRGGRGGTRCRGGSDATSSRRSVPATTTNRGRTRRSRWADDVGDRRLQRRCGQPAETTADGDGGGQHLGGPAQRPGGETGCLAPGDPLQLGERIGVPRQVVVAHDLVDCGEGAVGHEGVEVGATAGDRQTTGLGQTLQDLAGRMAPPSAAATGARRRASPDAAGRRW